MKIILAPRVPPGPVSLSSAVIYSNHSHHTISTYIRTFALDARCVRIRSAFVVESHVDFRRLRRYLLADVSKVARLHAWQYVEFHRNANHLTARKTAVTAERFAGVGAVAR